MPEAVRARGSAVTALAAELAGDEGRSVGDSGGAEGNVVEDDGHGTLIPDAREIDKKLRLDVLSG